jgi:protein-S-isoprenylcysteine O-methyltransferase Ste14
VERERSRGESIRAITPMRRALREVASFDERTTRGYTQLQQAGRAMFVIFRAITYATLFIGFLLIYLPARVLASADIVRPPVIGAPQISGIIAGSIGAVLALWCIFTFATIGKGTPAPFDPPRRLVIRGPYRFVRNPMYIGAALALAGAALFYKSAPLVAYAAAFLVICHLFVLAYEEPRLRRTFGADYEAYCQRVRRWWPAARTAP